ncbi:hypothetical protein Moror_11239 [Moniliophthora roreri MCA 2997]|uniref:Uncharacterized protein n=1 Tax=Moniliophthora roreri (strain MCA 2997) TaxID=1381753 RepID=V2WM40_MONRO|nr:hypothetical protein Moror_11239 [Moniliophthora roreri MCA 2997]
MFRPDNSSLPTRSPANDHTVGTIVLIRFHSSPRQQPTTTINSSTPQPDPLPLTQEQLRNLNRIHPEYRHLLLAEIEADHMQPESRASTSNPDSLQPSATSQRPLPTPSDDSMERIPCVQLTVWDEEEEKDDRDLHPVRTSNNPMTRPMAWTEEVYARLNALFARWEPTAPSTVETTVVRFADNLRLGIYLDTATNDDGLVKLRDRMLPSAIELLTSISQDLITTMISMGTVNNNRNNNNNGPKGQTEFVEGQHMYVIDNGGARVQLAEFEGKWRPRELISSNLEVRA